MPPKVIFVASEVAPFRKTGGLADVSGALPKALARHGADVRVVMPLYQGMPWDDLEPLDGALPVPMHFGVVSAGVRRGLLPASDVPVYCVEFNHYFDRQHVYGPPGGAYPDNLERYAFLSRAALELAKGLDFIPDVLHANDWQTALVPTYLDAFEREGPLHAAASIYTIHNLAYQGQFGPGDLVTAGLAGSGLPFDDLHVGPMLNLMKAGIRRATLLSTVSPNYAREIQTEHEGFGLHEALAARATDLRGVLNGIDVDEWNPETDAHLPARYSAADPRGKAVCKAALQRELGLPVRADVPLIAIISRLTFQKGLDVVADALDRLLAEDLQLALLGSGDPAAEQSFVAGAARHPARFAARIGFDEALSHRLEAAADYFLMPSRFEPCGLNQMYSLRYGTLPIVRATGGLLDTVVDAGAPDATGFVFGELGVEELVAAVRRAAGVFGTPEAAAMRRRGMTQDFSWDRAATAYLALYDQAIDRARRRTS